MFNALHISGSGLTVMRTWMDAVSDNIANINTARTTDSEAFRARYVEAVAGEPGVAVGGIELGDPAGRLVSQPDHPLADENGMVRYPSIDLGDQMTMMMVAQRAYQANLSVIDRARDTYLAALQIGR